MSSAGPSVVVFLGAGFSYVAGVPLAGQLFDDEPLVDRITRRRLVERVQAAWHGWRSRVPGGAPEEYLADLSARRGIEWLEAVWYASLVIALRMGRLEYVGATSRVPTITRHNLDRTTNVPTHEDFWTTIFTRTSAVTVVTTNYDVLAERGLRTRPRPRVPRPGFHYGHGPEYLLGGGYPSYSHIQRISASGSVPLLKLHGSVSWSLSGGQIARYHDCRPAIRGDALIVAPVAGKRVPDYLVPTWELARDALHSAGAVITVGYSLPEYDHLVLELLRETNAHAEFHLFDPDPAARSRYERLLHRRVEAHPGLPAALPDLAHILDAWFEDGRVSPA